MNMTACQNGGGCAYIIFSLTRGKEIENSLMVGAIALLPHSWRMRYLVRMRFDCNRYMDYKILSSSPISRKAVFVSSFFCSALEVSSSTSNFTVIFRFGFAANFAKTFV